MVQVFAPSSAVWCWSAVRDIVHAWGGVLQLQDSPFGGLRVSVELARTARRVKLRGTTAALVMLRWRWPVHRCALP
jgi:hypothetical protein